ncbi:MAG: fasciclin domain-containing protein [Pseudomonadota bacterium]
MKTLIKAAALAATATLAAGAAQSQTIAEIASGDERFSTLVAAVSAAGLVDTLNSDGPFTVYAPVNDAFAALPAGTVETLLQPENKGQLTNVLLYHVDDRNLPAENIPAGSNYFKPVLATERLCITKNSSGVSIADGSGESANVVIANIKASNGVIHVIDKVLLPGNRPDCH